MLKSLNPGNLKSELQRHLGFVTATVLKLILYTPIHGAYTELFAGLSPEVTPAKNGAWSKCIFVVMLSSPNLISPTLGSVLAAQRGYRSLE
jgi:hypothetical protein